MTDLKVVFQLDKESLEAQILDKLKAYDAECQDVRYDPAQNRTPLKICYKQGLFIQAIMPGNVESC